MKMLVRITGISIIIFIVICRIVAHQYDYPIGRDTYKAFGNREYQILNNSTAKTGIKTQSLHNEKYRESIIDNLAAYKNTLKYVYFVGNGVYIRLDKQTNRILYCPKEACTLHCKSAMENDGAIELLDRFDLFSEKDKYYFNKLNDK